MLPTHALIWSGVDRTGVTRNSEIFVRKGGLFVGELHPSSLLRLQPAFPKLTQNQSTHPLPPFLLPSLHRFISKITIPKDQKMEGSPTFTLREHPDAKSAARDHDACAIGVFGVSAIAHLNFPLASYGLNDVIRSIDRMCILVRVVWTRYMMEFV
jgi:hypothetical protein